MFNQVVKIAVLPFFEQKNDNSDNDVDNDDDDDDNDKFCLIYKK